MPFHLSDDLTPVVPKPFPVGPDENLEFRVSLGGEVKSLEDLHQTSFTLG